MFVVCQEVSPCIKPSLCNMAIAFQDSKIGYIGMTDVFHLLQLEDGKEVCSVEDSIAVDTSEDGVVIDRVSTSSVDLLIRKEGELNSSVNSRDLFADRETVSFPRPIDVSSIRIFHLGHEGYHNHFS